MESPVNHWGEFDDSQEGLDDWTLSFTDMEELLFPQPPRPSPPSLYQPSQEETASFQILAPELCRSDSLVLQTIRLLQHQRQLLQLIGRAQTYGIDVNSSLPSFPDDPPIERKSAKQHYLNFLPPNTTTFMEGAQKPQKLQIEASTSRLILRKAVATIFAHSGYTDTTESVLRVMTDIGHDFLTKFTSLLRTNTDHMLLTDNCPFHDVVEQTLFGMGMGGMASLHSHYRDRIVGYHARVRQRTLQLHHQYQMLLAHAGSSLMSSSLRRESATPSSVDSQAVSTTEDCTQPPPVYQFHSSSSNFLTAINAISATEDLNVSSIKSTSSGVDHEFSNQAFSVHSQPGVDMEEESQSGPPPPLYSSISR